MGVPVSKKVAESVSGAAGAVRLLGLAIFVPGSVLFTSSVVMNPFSRRLCTSRPSAALVPVLTVVGVVVRKVLEDRVPQAEFAVCLQDTTRVHLRLGPRVW